MMEVLSTFGLNFNLRRYTKGRLVHLTAGPHAAS